MDISKTFEEIILKEKESQTLEFLKSLDTKGKKELAKKLKDFKYVWEYNHKSVSANGFTYEEATTPKGTPTQKKIYTMASFFCDNQKAFEKEWSATHVLDKELMNTLLPVYCPPWFDNYINNINTNGWSHTRLDYLELIELELKGYISLKPEMIANKLPQIISQNENQKSLYVPENLVKFDITTERDIWHLFEYESGMHWMDNYTNYENHKEGSIWTSAFLWLLELGKLDRSKVLKESLLASNRNFNKTVSGWFAQFFISLEANKDELISLQDEIISLLIAPHSKVVNTALNLLKKIATEKNFDREHFLSNMDMVLSSEVKSVVKSAMMILEKLAQKNPDLRGQICKGVLQIFSHQDNELQLRGAKLLQKYLPEDEDISSELSMYENSIFSDAKNIVVAISSVEILEETNQEFPLEKPELVFEPFPVAKDFEEFMFLASQAFDNNDPSHLDLLLDGVIRLQSEIKGDNIEKLEPALQRALKRLIGDFTSSIGYLDNVLATFFIEYCDILVAQNPEDSKIISNLLFTYRKKDLRDASESHWYEQKITPLTTWRTSESTPIYFLYKNLLFYIQKKVRNNDSTPLISTPTHAPHWISPNTLIKRVASTQKNGQPIDSVDLQIGLSRLNLSIETLDKKLLNEVTGEMRQILEYGFGEEVEIPENSDYHGAWAVASFLCGNEMPDHIIEKFTPGLKQGDYTGQFSWEVGVEKYRQQTYSWEKKKQVWVDLERKGIQVIRPKEKPQTQSKKGLFGFFKKSIKAATTKSKPYAWNSLYADQELKERWLSAVDNDIPRFFSLIPNNPGPLVLSIINRCITHADLFSETDKRVLVNSLQHLISNWNKYEGITQDFIGMSMMCPDKTARTIAGEIWIQETQYDQMDQKLIGQSIGKMNAHDFAPIKRFTDLALSVYNVSVYHKHQMNVLLGACIKELPEEPPRNSKKLLELYKETMKLNQIMDDESLNAKLQQWKSSKSLVKLIELIAKT